MLFTFVEPQYPEKKRRMLSGDSVNDSGAVVDSSDPFCSTPNSDKSFTQSGKISPESDVSDPAARSGSTDAPSPEMFVINGSTYQRGAVPLSQRYPIFSPGKHSSPSLLSGTPLSLTSTPTLYSPTTSSGFQFNFNPNQQCLASGPNSNLLHLPQQNFSSPAHLYNMSTSPNQKFASFPSYLQHSQSYPSDLMSNLHMMNLRFSGSLS